MKQESRRGYKDTLQELQWPSSRRQVIWAVVIGVLLTLSILVVLGHIRKWEWVGIEGATLWDWMQLLIVPGVLALGAFELNQRAERKDRIRAVLETCNRASVRTDMYTQSSLDAMFESLEACRIDLQQRIAYVSPKDQQKRVEDVIEALQFIKDCQIPWANGSLPDRDMRENVNDKKIHILAKLDELARKANVLNPLPRTTEQSHFFQTLEEANKPEGQ